MKSDIELLDAAAKLTGSDSETARQIGSRQQVMCDVRNGRRDLTAAQAAQIADLLGLPWLEEAFPRLAAKEKSYKARRYWLGKLPQLRGIAATVGMVGLSAMILALGGGNTALPSPKESAPRCILC